jgi:hypothetical protein
MIVRVHFEGIVENNGTKSVLSDYVDIHIAPDKGLLRAKEVFLNWTAKSGGIRGANTGVFHPLGGWGDIKVKRVVEIAGDEEVPCPVETSLSPPTTEKKPNSLAKTRQKKSLSPAPPASPPAPKKSS